MSIQSFSLNFDGYWKEDDIAGIPKESGVFCVYTSYYHPQEMTESIRALIYIGEGNDVNGRITSHEKWPDWRRQLRPSEKICFNFAPVRPSSDLERVAAALVFQHKPPENSEGKDSFRFDDTTISVEGKSKLLQSNFTAKRTPPKNRE
jgi:hypothetical protein